MGHEDYQINVYARKPFTVGTVVKVVRALTAGTVVKVVQALPKPETVWAELSREHKKVAKGQLTPSLRLDSPSKKAVVNLLSDRDVSQALDMITLNYGGGESQLGCVHVQLTPGFARAENADEIYGETDLAGELERRSMQTMRHVAAITHESGNEGKLDRRVFDYGRKVVTAIIPKEAMTDYALILHEFQDRYFIVSRDTFLGSLDDLIRQNCQGVSKPALPANVYVHYQVDESVVAGLRTKDITTKSATIAGAYFGRHPVAGPFTSRTPLGLNVILHYTSHGLAGATYTKMSDIERLMDDFKAQKPEDLVGKTVLACLKKDRLLGLAKVKR